MDPAGAETEPAWMDAERAPGDGDEVGGAAAWREESAIRDALGVESAFGFHVEGGAARRLAPSVRKRHCGSPDADEPGDVWAGGDEVAIAVRDEPARRSAANAYPCLGGVRYGGCLGSRCELEICWTGGATVSFARRQREAAHVSTALYVPGAPCHNCSNLLEDEVSVPRPRALGQPGATRASLKRSATGAGERSATQDAETSATVRLQRVSCGRGLWEHPISLSSFLMKRIPLLDQSEPERCPGFVQRPEPHPAVVAHLRLRSERARLRRLERRAAGEHEG